MVRVSCMTYNHAPYIESALNGFCMQETTFSFVCTIVDDASTDGTPQVIRNYMWEHFDLENREVVRNEETEDYYLLFAQHRTNKNCFFAVLLLKYNHYSIGKPKRPYLDEWEKGVKYIALCEGDDYWVDANKLQIQVEFLNTHSTYTMTCTRTYLFSQKEHKVKGESYCYTRSRNVSVKDMIYRTGLFVSTCSIVYRKEVTSNVPDYWRKCRVGDYPLQIACVLKGEVWYFNNAMSVYRVENTSSWMGQQKWKSGYDIKRLEVIKSIISMFYGFASDYPQYSHFFKSKIADQINRNYPFRETSNHEKKYYLNYFSNEIKQYPLRWRLDLMVRKIKLPLIRYYYQNIFMRCYSKKIIKYK